MTNLQKQLDAQRRLVDVDHYDITVRELLRMIADKELNRAPTYQRKFRWDERDESRLIESILLGLPVPSIFVASNENGTWEVIDGLQRLSTVVHFMADPPELLEAIEKDSPLKLNGLTKLTEANGKTYEDLPMPVRLAFGKRSIRVTALSDKSDYAVRFEMFERLNTGGVVLTPQEVRGCVFRSEFNDLLGELANSREFKTLVKLQRAKRDDGTREELVLKFFAYLRYRNEFSGAVTEFLNSYMASVKEDFDITAGRRLFTTVSTSLLDIIGGSILRRGYANTPLNQAEAIFVAAAEIIESGGSLSPREDWLNDASLVRYSTKGTNTVSALNGRISRAKELLEGAAVEPRN